MGSTTTENVATIETKSTEQIRIDQLKAELAIEEEKVRLQAKAVREQEEEIKRKQAIESSRAANEAKISKVRVYAEAMVAALVAADVDCEVKEGRIEEYGSVRLPSVQFASNEVNYSIGLNISERYSGGDSWRRGTFKGYQIQVGQYGERKTYPQLKSGGFNYLKIVAEVAKRISDKVATAKREQELRAAKATATELAAALKASVIDSGYDRRGRYVSKSPMIVIGIERARELVAMLEGLTNPTNVEP